MISPQRRNEIIDSLRKGTVPRQSLDSFAVGLDHLTPALDEELERIRIGSGVFKAVRGEYGSGKTFFSRWLQERARSKGFASAEVQISESETPLHHLEKVYRRLLERLATPDTPNGALRSVIDSWLYTLEEDVLSRGQISESDTEALLAASNELMEKRLGEITRTAPAFSAVLRAYRRAMADGDTALADGLLAWLSGQPSVAASVKKAAAIKGDIDHFTALSFLQGLLLVLRDSGHPGLLFVLDEVETLQRVRADVREKGLNALRQLIDEIDAGRFPGLYLLITGTPAFFEGPQGVKRLPPLAQRLDVDFQTDARFDNPRAVQIRLPGFDLERLQLVGHRIRDIYAQGASAEERIRNLVDDAYVADLARAVTGGLGGKVGIAPRIFLKKLVGDVLDRVDQFADFDPRRDYALTLGDSELNDAERAAKSGATADDIELDL
jgi:hypothetical protein